MSALVHLSRDLSIVRPSMYFLGCDAAKVVRLVFTVAYQSIRTVTPHLPNYTASH